MADIFYVLCSYVVLAYGMFVGVVLVRLMFERWEGRKRRYREHS